MDTNQEFLRRVLEGTTGRALIANKRVDCRRAMLDSDIAMPVLEEPPPGLRPPSPFGEPKLYKDEVVMIGNSHIGNAHTSTHLAAMAAVAVSASEGMMVVGSFPGEAFDGFTGNCLPTMLGTGDPLRAARPVMLMEAPECQPHFLGPRRRDPHKRFKYTPPGEGYLNQDGPTRKKAKASRKAERQRKRKGRK